MSDKTLQVGASAQLEWEVERRWCTQRGDYHIFSTPSMVQLAERAAMEVLAPVLAPGKVSVGTRVDIRHLAPTLEGMSVRAVATVIAVDDARVEFHVDIFDDFVKVGEATHERYVLDLERYLRRLDKKRAELQAHKTR